MGRAGWYKEAAPHIRRVQGTDTLDRVGTKRATLHGHFSLDDTQKEDGRQQALGGESPSA